MLERFYSKDNPSSGESKTPAIPKSIDLAKVVQRLDWKRLLFIFLGITLFIIVYCSPDGPDAGDPKRVQFP